MKPDSCTRKERRISKTTEEETSRLSEPTLNVEDIAIGVSIYILLICFTITALGKLQALNYQP